MKQQIQGVFARQFSSRLPRQCAVLLCLASVAAVAERADRAKPMTLESDKPCTVNLLKQTSICSGNVVVTQGTMTLRADRLELQESPDGYQTAVASGSDGRPASFRQRRDGASDEYIEGQGQRIEYDGKTLVLRFTGTAVVRRMRGANAADEVHGSQVVWDGAAEQLTVQGGSTTAANPGGRVRAVIAPRLSASTAAAAPTSPPPTLQPTPALGERR